MGRFSRDPTGHHPTSGPFSNENPHLGQPIAQNGYFHPLNRKRLRSAAVQTRPVANSPRKTILQGVKLARKAAEKEADVICLPEHWLPEKTIPTPVDPIPALQKLAREYGVIIAAGAFYERQQGHLRLSCPVI